MKKNYARHWSYLMVGPILAFFLILFWYFNQSYLSQNKGPVASLLENPILTFGLIIFGAFLSSFVSGEYSIKTPVSYEPLIFSFIGGILMGCGAVIAAMSTHSIVLFNLAGIFNLTAFMITKGWIYAVCMIFGGFIGAKLFSLLILKTSHFKKDFFIPQALMLKKTQKIIFIALFAIFVLFLLVIVLFSLLNIREKIGFLFASILLLVFGIIVERGTICMSSMLKEWFIAHSAYVWRSILFTIMCLALFYQIGQKLSLFKPIQLETQIQNIGLLISGSFLMGFGFIFSDGCFIGSLWKAGQGNIINIIGILGMLIGIGISQVFAKFVNVKQQIYGISNYLDATIDPFLFIIILWVIGALLLLIFRPRHYRY